MTREELYIEALEDSKSILIERGGYHSVISGRYKIIKDLNTQKIKVMSTIGDYYEESEIEFFLKNGWRNGINKLNLEKK